MNTFRIHPAIGVARVGNSAEYVIAPETMAGQPDPRVRGTTGGLPIPPDRDGDVVKSGDLRDAQGALKRHAARFRIFAYDDREVENWPRGDGIELTIGSRVGDRTVTKIIWTVHVANKKANWFRLREDEVQGIASFENGLLPNIRNPSFPKPGEPQPTPEKRIDVLNDPKRIAALTIDPGPRAIEGGAADVVAFDARTLPSVYNFASKTIVQLPDYPVQFPVFAGMELPAGPIESLGELKSDAFGRLLVLGGYGRAAGWKVGGKVPVDEDVNNDQWFDDTSDGPVSATLIFDDGTCQEAASAWVTTTDPSFAPQILNIVSAWDDIYDCWVRNLDLEPALYDHRTQTFRQDYKPSFDDQIAPIFRSAAQQRWVTNMSPHGISAHDKLAEIVATDDPRQSELAGIVPIFRNPFLPDDPLKASTNKMPLALGDGFEPFLSLRKTQYFFLERWNAGLGSFQSGGKALGPGEFLDKAVLVNCIGGRFSPGIDVTFIVRESAIYVQPWQSSKAGPFRIKKKVLDYSGAHPDRPLLTIGYVPRHREDEGLEPGDLGKFMAVPWHTDYNSCATHPPYPNPTGNRRVFWSWPAQRPVAINLASDVHWVEKKDSESGDVLALTPVLGAQRWSVRGYGTDSPEAEKWGRYQLRLDMLDNWHRIGVVLQSTRIDDCVLKAPSANATQKLPAGDPVPGCWFLEAGSQLRDTNRTPVVPFPNIATYLEQTTSPSPAELDARALFHQLLNVSDYPGVLESARAFVHYWLQKAEDISNDPSLDDQDLRFFDYTEQAFKDRLDLIYDDLADSADKSHPGDPTGLLRSRDDAIERIKQLAPFNLLDGAWLRNIARAGPQDEVRAMLFSVWMDELGDGDVSMHHCNIYRDLCHSVGYHPQPIDSEAFAFDQTFLDSAFVLPAFELAISQFTEDFFPEIIGMTLQLEWGVLDLKHTRDSMEFFGINPHFYVMHIGIDNAVNGHGQRAADAVRIYLGRIEGDECRQRAWRRIWNGYVAFQTVGNLGQDFKEHLAQLRKPDLRDQMIKLISSKAEFGSRNHQRHTLGETRLDEWFLDPAGFLDALATYGYLTPGDWRGSRLYQLMTFQNGPMYRVFTEDEIALWEAYVNGLGKAPQPLPPPLPPAARQMAHVVEELGRRQDGIEGHRQYKLAGHDIAWWFEKKPEDFLAALARPENGYVVPGYPDESPLYTDFAAPGRPMGPVFDQAAPDGSGLSCREVLFRWIAEGLVQPSTLVTSLGLNTPAIKRNRHPTGHIRGMGTRH